MEANQRKRAVLCAGCVRCAELGGMLSCELECGRARGSGCLVALLPLPRTSAASRGAWAPLLRRLVRPSRLGVCGGWQGTVRTRGSCRRPLCGAGRGGQTSSSFAKLAGQLPRALVRAGAVEPFGA